MATPRLAPHPIIGRSVMYASRFATSILFVGLVTIAVTSISCEEPEDFEELEALEEDVDVELRATTNPCSDPNHRDDNKPHSCALPGECLPGYDFMGDYWGHRNNGGATWYNTAIACESGPPLYGTCVGGVNCPDPCHPGQNITPSPENGTACLGGFVQCDAPNNGTSPSQSKCVCSDYPLTFDEPKTYARCPTACA